MPRITPPEPSPVRDTQVVRAVLDLLEQRFEANAPCDCRFFSCPQCDVYDLYKSVQKLHTFVGED